MWRYVMGGPLPYMTSAPNQDANWIGFLISEIFSKEKKITFLTAQICFFFQREPEFRPPMSEVVQQLVRMMQRASIVRRHSDDLGFSYRAPEREGVGAWDNVG
jgi:hypothetical protein